ncbi:non-ribosomal peptide synthetase/type I polyketide synthase [Catellatospora tritici]|uniref:non-ribosomal peptide synthetase/type I polyketide synthase n=1 Tax=Catellatospora tritici TaxID=2851566 RepID=UPI001C2D361D|nr:non-ribosomal peptide synthetase/type I polyketide synthase [Catellatospora tritici]MBV1850751.1 amino acid adenylation domain-containing protein [Catellatospora tritici]MBV1851004.1 amino acid adenylation domain-containing protein [Catellatospora tritici]
MTRIAVVGMAGRFPGAADPEQLWRNSLAGIESLSRFDVADLAASGLDPTLLADPAYVPAAGVIDGVDRFDAALFGYSPREAELLDPQHRHFLEVVWSALEHAGRDPLGLDLPVGVFGGARLNTYLVENLLPHRGGFDDLALLGTLVGNDKDFLATGVAYRLGLTGPAMTVQTACSTSLVATHLACQSLLSGECDLAVAGGAAIAVPHLAGYRHHQGGIYSPDGHCRAFSADAAGTVGGSGVAAVVLRRLDDALADGDPVHAVILASAVNNDGRRKVGFTAPSVEGQTRVIAEALALADVNAATVGYVEAHGTGTQLGDPIEVTALTAAFRADTDAVGYCGLGSAKPNVGHLDAAAGVTGLIRAVLAVRDGMVPPTVHFRHPNPATGLERSPFFVAATAQPWRVAGPRRAGVSSFGIGGTNAHVVLEQAPPRPATPVGAGPELLVLSAATPQVLDTARERLAEALTGADLPLGDVAATLRHGRTPMAYRLAVVADDPARAAVALGRAAPSTADADPRVVFLFPGQGAQRPGAGTHLYRTESHYRDAIDHAAAVLRPRLGLDLRDLLHADPDDPQAAALLTRTRLAQPALFATGWALTRLWRSWGVEPAALVGHSLGEYLSATVAGVFAPDDALRLVARRGELMDALPGGTMLAVLSGPEAVADLVGGEVALAAVNAPQVCVLSGPDERIAEVAVELAGRGVRTRPVTTSHAFHSPMMAPAADALRAEIATLRLGTPAIPFTSSLTGQWITPTRAADPDYWTEQLLSPVRFGDALAAATAAGAGVLLELGPGRTLTGLASAQVGAGWAAYPGLDAGDPATVLRAIGAAWCAGVPVAPSAADAGRLWRRVPLPTYPFDRRRYWIDPPRRATGTAPLPTVAPETPVAESPVAETGMQPDVAAQVAEIWRELLGAAEVDNDDDFRAVGGHSLLGAQLGGRLQARFGVRLNLGDVLAAGTLGKLIELVREALSEGTVAASRVVARPADAGAPLTFAQQRLWVLEQLDPGTAVYHLPFVLHLRGPLDVTALERALSRVLARHEVLRARFTVIDGDPAQPAAAPQPVTLTVHEPGDLDAEVRRPFDLATGPAIRFRLERLGPDEHRLVVTAHHLLLDGWSVGVLVSELGRAYADPDADLGPAPVQCGDVAHWQRAADTGGLDFWTEALDGYDDQPALPFGSATPGTMPSGRGGRVEDHLDLPATPRLYPLLLAGLGVLLSRLGGADRLVVGSPVANRPHPELEETVGLLANTLPIPLDLRGEPTGRQLLARVTSTVDEALAHQQVPFERIVAAVGGGRRAEQHPLFNVLLVLQNAPMPPLRLGELDLTVQDVHTGTAKFDLTVDVTPVDGRLRVSFEYSADAWSAQTAGRMLARYLRLLTALAADLDRPVGQLPLLDATDLAEIADWTSTSALPERTVTELVDAAVATTPDALAVSATDGELTYAQLSARADAVAELLHRGGVRPGDRVAVCAPRGSGSVAALLGVLRTGACYVPLDPSYPAPRLAAMLTRAQARHVLTLGEPELPIEGRTRHRIEDAVSGRRAPRHRVEPDALCYVVFTSGSTGQPKGIGLAHRALANLVQWQVERSAAHGATRTAQLTPYSFDVHFQEVFATLAAGGTLVVAADELRRDPAELLRWLNAERVGRLFLPYVSLAGLADAARRADTVPTSLREVVTAGERLQVTAPVRELFTRLPDCVLDNHYGPAESHVVTAELLTGDPADWPALPAIGTPLPGVELSVRDRCGGPATPGAPGELVIGGVQLCDGYLDDPQTTARRFHDGRYRTGDLVRRLADGRLEYLGRTDQQVKIRGHRVEPEEIETVLGGHRLVRECAVVAGPGPDGRLRLLAYAVTEATGPQLREWLAARLPTHLVPARITALAELPRTPSGKVDRRALAAVTAPVAAPAAARLGDVRAALVADAMAAVLDQPVGPDDDFFALGGDSILAISLTARLTEAGIAVAPRDVFTHPSPAALAEAAGATVDTVLPATPRQLALRQARPHQAVLPQPGRVDPAELRKLLDRLVARQPALRARLTGAVLRLPAPEQSGQDSPLVEVDLTDLSPLEASEHARRLAADAGRGLSPERGPVLALVLCHGPDRDLLALAAHPAMLDEASWRELCERLGGEQVDVPEGVDRSWARWLAAPVRPPRRPADNAHRSWPQEVYAAGVLLSGHDVALIRDTAPAAARRDGALGQWEREVFVPADPVPADLAEALRRVKDATATVPPDADPVPVSQAGASLSLLRGVAPAATLTPADFPLARLDADGLARIVTAYGVPDDVYPATPLQRTMLARIADGARPGLYSVRTTDALPAFIDPVALRAAFDALVARHPILRTAFVQDGLDVPVQVVCARATMPWTDLDWRDAADPAELRRRLREHLDADFTAPFDPASAPLARCTLIRLRGGYQLVFTAHHLLLDGWSRSLLLQDLPALYARALTARPAAARLRTAAHQLSALPRLGLGAARTLSRAQREQHLPADPPTPGDHAAALAAVAPADEYWDRYLRDSPRGTPLPPAAHPDAAGGYGRRTADAEHATIDALTRLARDHGITTAVAAQAAWATVLAQQTGAAEVVFGVTTSGRRAELPGYDRMVGLFINTLPQRAVLGPDTTGLDLMRRIQADAAAAREAEHAALVDLERRHGGRLFGSIVVVDNFPQHAGQHELAALLRRGHPFAGEHFDLGMTEFPLRLEVIPVDGLHVALGHHRDEYGDADADALLSDWLTTLHRLAKETLSPAAR